MSDIYGTSGNDTLNGTSAGDNIIGFDGNDTIDGGAGNDVVIGDGGNDVLLGGAGADLINGGDGDDVIYADEQDTHVRGDAGYDVVYIQGSVGVNWILENFYYTGIEELHGTSGNDSVNNYGVADMAIYGEGGDDTLMGNLGNNTLDGGTGNDLLSGGNGDDVLRGGDGDDWLTGDWGNDVLTGGAGVDLMNGGDGDDVLNADANDLYVRGDAGYDKVYIEGGTGVNWYIDGFYKSGMEEAYGSGGADTIVNWEPTAVSLFGRGGEDFLAGHSGNDTLAGGTESDTLYGGDGDDRYLFNLGDGIDTIQDTSSGAGNRIVFGAGIGQQDLTPVHDQLSLTLTIQVGTAGDALRLMNFDPNGVAGSMVVSTLFFDDGSQVSLADLLGLGSGSGATITGTNGDDFLQGTAEGDVIDGLAGNDTLEGLGGDDTMTGGVGADQLFGGSGNDVLNVDAADFLVMGGDGYDVAYVNDSQGVYWYMDDLGSMSGLEEVHGGVGNDTLRYVGPNAVNLFGGDGADYLSGSAGADLLDGGDGTDVLEGQDGHNILRGGAGGDSLTGGTGNDVLQGGTGADYMWGGNGDDIYIVDDAGDQVSESDLFSGNDTIESSVNVFGADSGIDNITLTGATADWANGNGRDNVITGNSLNNYLFDGWAGNDTLRGNDGDDYLSASIGNDTLEGGAGWDRLYGGDGDDMLDGGTGFDNMEGGRGNDTYVVDHVSDQVQELWNEGTDTVVSSIDYSLWNVNLENLTLTGNMAQSASGNDGDNTITGNDIGNWLLGWNGNDTLGGMGGNDQLLGWDGDDVLQGGSGFDYLSGDAGDDQLFGGDEQDQLYGGVGSDVLDGGTGADWMVGGLGDDIYVVDNPSDQIQELWDEGTDTVLSSIDYWMAGNDVDNLTLTGTQAYVGAGNFKDNIIIGNDANNYLYGGDGNDRLNGGAGTDILYGNTGDDTYIVDNQGDYLWEFTAEGSDTVESSISYALGSDLENLTLTGSMAWSGTGNELDNVLTGNSLDNMLDGGAGDDTLAGGIGNDYLIGGAGNDTYRFNLGDGIDTIQDFSFPVEGNRILFGQGITLQDLTLTHDPLELTLTIQVGNGGDAIRLTNFDPSYSRVVATLQFNDGSQVAMAELLGPTQGDDILNGTPGDDVIDGLGGNDVINGMAGNDTLLGGEGNDTLNGGDGDDLLDGGIYSDTMVGGAGNDTYFVDQFDEIVTEAVGEGVDTVQSSISGYTLSANVENLTLTGTATSGIGNELDNVLVGNDGFNFLNGWAGSDQLNGGLGADSMAGMAGDDTYVVDDAGDVLIESAGEGNDTAYSSVSYDLSTQGNEVETLMLTGMSSIDAKGNWSDNTLIGNTGDNVLDGSFGNDTMQGAGGNDTYIVSEFGDVVIEQANDGIDTVQSSVVSYTLGTNVENLTLTGFAFDGTGNELSNILTGNEMNNRLDGRAGSDIMIGGLGDDTYVVDNAGVASTDLVVENVGEGIDAVESSVDYTLAANVERLTMTGVAVRGTGNESDNTIQGTDGNNIIDGGIGADTMAGALGDDIYVVDNVGDVIFDVGPGIDTVQTAMSYELGTTAALENLTLTGSAAVNGTGNFLDNTITGNDAANILDGQYGNDTLIGSGGNDRLVGGFGSDTLLGGTGNDIYVVDQDTDTIMELANEGTDTVESTSFDYTLSANVENLTLTGTGFQRGVGNFSSNTIMGTADGNVLLGEDGNDVLQGNAGSDSLSGGAGSDLLDGGVGADTMYGGTGDDVYQVDDASDLVSEFAGEGNDTINSSVSYTLLGDSEVETVILTGSASNNATGSYTNNALIGNSAANILDGGAGDDTMAGGQGDDTYVVDSLFDVVTESLGQGIDTVQSSIGSGNALAANVENLTLTGAIAIMANGNSLDNVIRGNSAANIIDGQIGADTMIGGDGNDSYLVDNANDIVIENIGEGVRDVVLSSVTYSLAANVEELWLQGATGINATGNGLDNTLMGNSAANVLDGATGVDSMWGGAGNDTYVVDNINDAAIESANEGIDTVQSSVTYILGANVENQSLIGTAAINATGNNLDNVLTGNSAANVLDGGIGADAMSGGVGDDTYVVDNAADVVTENLNEGIDTVQSSVTATLTANVENLTLTGTTAINGTGNVLNNVLTGNSAANMLTGGAGNDTYNVGAGDSVVEAANSGTDTVQSSVTWTLGSNLENLTLTGSAAINGTGNTLDNVLTGNSAANTLTGGAGNDTYVVSTGDTVVEAANAGTDTVQSDVTHTLANNVENLVLTGTSAINGTGNSLINTLTGNSGDNVLNGGAGADTLAGLDGNDTYVVDNTGDVINELTNNGTDLVQSSVTYTLAANVENLTLTGSSGISGTGNTLDNVLTGNSAANTLTGGGGNDTLNGGTGNDTMIGGTGDDTYVINATGDVVTENLNEGTDTVQSSVTATLAANVENLTLTGSTGINGTGNTLDNVLIGNNANNQLTGGAGNDTLDGGTGNDTMVGGTGNDTFVVTAAGDVVTENANEGTDTVQSSLTYTLGANVENLTLTGTAAINGTGNTLDNQMIGNSGANVLSGANGADTLRGGQGNDTVNGGSGNDTFQFGRGEGQDLVQDNSGSDKILYDAGINPLDLVISRQANDLRLSIHGSTDQITIQNWYTSSSNRTETIQAGNGQTLLSTQVDQLIQAMAGFTQQTGLTWDQGIDQQPAQVQSILAASWQ